LSRGVTKGGIIPRRGRFKFDFMFSCFNFIF
jgi:hypothetical protein